MNFDQQNNPDYGNQQNTGIGQQNQPNWANQQNTTGADPDLLDQSQDTGFNQSSTGTGSAFRAGDSQTADSGLMGQDNYGQGKLGGTQTSDTSNLGGGSRGFDSTQNTDTSTGYGSAQQQYGSGGDTTGFGSSGGNYGTAGTTGTTGTTGDTYGSSNLGSGNQSYGGTQDTSATSGDYSSSGQDPSMTQTSNIDPMSQGGQAGNAWDDPNAQTGTTGSGSYNDPLSSTGGGGGGGGNWDTQQQQQQGHVSAGDKIKGSLKKFAGKLTSDQSKVAEGESQKNTGDPNLM